MQNARKGHGLCSRCFHRGILKFHPALNQWRRAESTLLAAVLCAAVLVMVNVYSAELRDSRTMLIGDKNQVTAEYSRKLYSAGFPSALFTTEETVAFLFPLLQQRLYCCGHLISMMWDKSKETNSQPIQLNMQVPVRFGSIHKYLPGLRAK